MTGVYIFLADGFEITEGLTTTNILRRGGIDAMTVSITDDYFVTSSNNTTVVTDLIFEEFCQESASETTTERDVMIFPGGLPGSENLANHTELIDMLKKHYEEGGTIAAICAAPGLVLSQLPIEGRRMTCYPGFDDRLTAKGAIYTAEGTETDGQFITGKGPGKAVEFGLAILEKLEGKEKAEAIRAQLM